MPSSLKSSPVPAPDPADQPTPAAESGLAFSPLYQQIKARLTDSLHQGEWKPGEAIPSEMELAARFRVSQGTVRKAIDELAADNRVVRRQGRGTFVATHAERHTQYRFLRLTPDDPAEAGPMARHVLDCKRLRAPADVARALALKAGEAVVFVRRTLSRHGRPVVLDDIWLPGELFKGLTAPRLAQYAGPMYGLFEAEFGVHMIRAEEKVRAVAADAASAALLDVTEGSPLMCVERIAHTYGDRPVELRRGLYVTTAHHYRNALS